MFAWGTQLAEERLAEQLPRRWAHVQGVARQARSLEAVVGGEGELLQTAAVLHDVGYASELAVSGFHPLDGALFLRRVGAPQRLVDLVAHHSGALFEARLRGFERDLDEFRDEHGPVRDALWYCDLTTSPNGEVVTASERLREIERRYGPEHVVTKSVIGASHELLEAVRRTEDRLASVATSS